jgi:acyl carrier protein phosphodiesterase
MAQAIAWTGLEPARVKLAKEMGCRAFLRGSRVDCDALVAWIKEHPEIDTAPPVTKEAVEIRLKAARAAKAEKDTERATVETERAKIELDHTRGRYWSRAEVAATINQIAQHQRAVLQRKLETELPPRLVGLDVIAIGQQMQAVVDEVCRILNDRTQQWV